MSEQGQVALITGAASGIGRHLVGAFASRGYRVLATDLRTEVLHEVASRDGWPAGQVALGALDVTQRAGWEATLAQALTLHSRVDVLLNVAGVLKPGSVTSITAEEVNAHLDVNVKGVIHGTRVVGAHMAERGAGHIINLGSLASLAAVPGLALYSASKFAVRGFSIASAQELEKVGVAVTLMMPDAVETPMLELQVAYPEAALTFSGPRALTVADVEAAVFDVVLPRRPLEIALPASRGILSRVAVALPRLAMRVRPMLEKKGLREQARRKGP